jgi:hypothetical protein
MKFVELDRGFLPLGKGDDPETEIGHFWSHKYSGALYWSELRQYPRVVLLAEASSGKTQEFRNQVDVLRGEGHAAFFVRIEELAEEGFEAALDPTDVTLFEAWHRGGAKGWFFLDSLDEARLNRKSFDTALKNLARAVGSALNRGHIFVSCRVSDWNGEKDRSAIERILPAYKAPDADDTGGNKLLDPIFDKENKKKAKKGTREKPIPVNLQIFRITPLITSQYCALATECGVTDVVAFSNAIAQNGLDMFTERPGDVIDLANYWTTHNRFDSFEKMTEYAVTLKLHEEDAYRPDNDVLSDAKARAGAEALAVALTFGKSFTLRVPSQDNEPGLSTGAIDPSLVLPDWAPAERNALSRRAIFAPATYARIRYHHRATQEYLTARRLLSLLDAGCPLKAVWSLLFVERYGVRTVVPSLHAVAAWLALWRTDIANEVIRREPLILIRHGDPGSLTVQIRERLLTTFAAKQAAGEISNDSLDHRSLWMFADRQLDHSIRASWTANPREEFRLDLLRLIREGEIYTCSDLALDVVRQSGSDEYYLTVAAGILRGEKKPAHLKELAKRFKRYAASLSSRTAAAYALAVFPNHITVKDLLATIAKVELGDKDRTSDIGYHLAELYQLCLTDADKRMFMKGLAALCLAPPFAHSYQRISQKYFELAKGLEAVARIAVAELGSAAPPASLVLLLQAVERSDRHIDLEGNPSLQYAIKSNRLLNRALFWADVRTERKRKGEVPATHIWQLYWHGSRLWELQPADIDALKEDLKQRTELLDRQIALSAVCQLLGRALVTKKAQLREVVKGVKELGDQLDSYLAPPAPPHPQLVAMQKKRKAHERAEEAQTELNKKSWVTFQETVVKKPGILRDAAKLKKWENGSQRLYSLTCWLQHRVDVHGANAAKEWRLLAEGYSQQVAEAYRDGMRIVWRVTKPEGRIYNPDGTFSYKHTSALSSSGVGVEASEDPDWVSKLTKSEVKQAFEHGVSDGFDYPEWMNDLLTQKARLLIPELRKILQTEWAAPKEHNSPFLYRFARQKIKIGPELQSLLLDVITGPEPGALKNLEYGIRILKNLDLGLALRQKLYALALKRLASFTDESTRDLAIRYIAWLMIIDVNAATKEFANWIGKREVQTSGYGEWAFGILYDRHDSIVYGVLDTATVGTLEASLDLAYSYVRPENDVRHVGAFTPGMRDAAEEGRNTILGALLARPGPEAYQALQRLSGQPAFKFREHRFKELAKGKAEKDTEFPAWSEAEVFAFQAKYTAPVKTGHDLLNVMSDVLADIQLGLTRDDVSSRSLLLKAEDENEVKNWLVEQMNFRANGRFLPYRETEIVFGDRPDVIASSTSAPVAVAFEVKHGGKNWSVKDHELALTSQLAKDYLKPVERRNGIFVISNHGTRTWRHPQTGATLQFGDLVKHLEAIASTIHANNDGAIQVRVFGLDAVQEKPEKAHRRRKKGTKAKPKKNRAAAASSA